MITVSPKVWVFIVILIFSLVAIGFAISRWLKWKDPLRAIVGVCVILLLFGGYSFFAIRSEYANKLFYQYRNHIMKKFDYVFDVDLENIGPYCGIAIFVRDEQVDYETIEPIFTEAMKEIYQESLFPYLVKKHKGDIRELEICIYNNQQKIVHRFERTKDPDIWEYEGDRSKKFKVSDYVE